MHSAPVPDGSRGRDRSRFLSGWVLTAMLLVGLPILGGSLTLIAVALEVTTPARGFGWLSELMQSLTMYLVLLTLLSAGLPPGFVGIRTLVDSTRSNDDVSINVETILVCCLECGAIVLAAVSFPVVVLFGEFLGGGFSSLSFARMFDLESVAGLDGHAAFVLFFTSVCLWIGAWGLASLRSTVRP
ncbi:hypothetical protein [Natronorubrum sp. DTA28]|uniref:hypothetical protein n=1 Tax=Natronorubrum sp. DTA28 TaxID=3447019 RepID=UPI003F846A8F